MSERKKLLLVEDEKDLLELIEMSLKKEFDVQSAIDGAAARDLFKNRGPFDVLVTDYHLGADSGVQLANDFLKIDPALKVVITTGDDASIVNEVNSAAKMKSSITKPYRAADLIKKIKELFF